MHLLNVRSIKTMKLPDWGGGGISRPAWGDDGDDDEQQQRQSQSYVAADLEKFLVEHAKELGLDSENPQASGCDIWKPNGPSKDLSNNLTAYGHDLDNHTKVIKSFQPIPNLLKTIRETGSHDVCKLARPHPDGIMALFPSNQLSLSASGYIEPLTPPMRSHHICDNIRQNLMRMDYLVHDFEAMCKKLKPTSKTVLIDMGASLSFHGSSQPAMELLMLYEKFGFYFDHIYGFEITFTQPEKVFKELLPQKYMASYHWINTGVSPKANDKMNPLHSILKQFNQDDFIVVKLDIDTPSIELPLARQVTEGGPDGIYHKLIDQFYFEHHVKLRELAPYWGRQVQGSVKDSLDLFYSMREKGIPAHFWP